MGQVKRILFQSKCKKPMLNNRMTVELCENVHIHYRNLRLEFPKEEFLPILKALKSIDEREVENFDYSDNSFKELFSTHNLPEKTEFDDRIVLEEQVGGHLHLHYRNLRIEHDA
jgi:hypothetical protein